MQHSTKKLGMMFTACGWALGFLLLALVFSKILDVQSNPNQSIPTSQTTEYREIILLRNRNGHYVFDGEINHKKVTLLVDTGATTTSIPGKLKDFLELKVGRAISVSTANGVTTAYMTRLDHLALGEIELGNVKATIVPGMGIEQILLGMNVLKNMELIQRGDSLIIRQYR